MDQKKEDVIKKYVDMLVNMILEGKIEKLELTNYKTSEVTTYVKKSVLPSDSGNPTLS